MKTTVQVSMSWLALAGASQAATLLYQETFNYTNPAGAQTGHNNAEINWRAHYGSGANDASSQSNAANNQYFGVVNNAVGFAAKVVTSATGPTAPIGIAWTEEAALTVGGPLNVSDLTKISFQSNSSDVNAQMRFVIRIDTGSGTEWYASNEIFRDSVARETTDSWQLQEFNFTAASANWLRLNFDPGNELGLLTDELDADLPSGNVTAVGIYFGSHSGNLRYDNFQVWGVPEPSAVALGMLGGLFGLRRRRL